MIFKELEPVQLIKLVLFF